MNPLFKAFIEREIKGIFGELCTSIYISDSTMAAWVPDRKRDALVVLVRNLDETRPKDKQLANIPIIISNEELDKAKFPLDLFKVRVKNAYTTMKYFIEEEAAA